MNTLAHSSHEEANYLISLSLRLHMYALLQILKYGIEERINLFLSSSELSNWSFIGKVKQKNISFLL